MPVSAAIVFAKGKATTQNHRNWQQVLQGDRDVIKRSKRFNADLFRPGSRGSRDGDSILSYLSTSRHAVPRDRLHAGRLLRRPLEGFNPLIYASDHCGFDEVTGEDPLAHFLRSGCPPGRWTHRVITPGATPNAPTAKTAIHGHFHYPDLLPDFLRRLLRNRTKPDLFITTTSKDRHDAIAITLEDAGITPKQLSTCENRGRDLWPFLALLNDHAFDTYDVIGHFHSKRSPHFAEGEGWRDFLWQHLVGDQTAMMDRIIASFERDPTLGLVFAEDPHLDGWEENLEIATQLAARAQISLPLPNHFDYPMGTMFWARPAALMPVGLLGLARDAMPAEPLPDDGTILHAIERLLPFLAAKAGFAYATTHVPGSGR